MNTKRYTRLVEAIQLVLRRIADRAIRCPSLTPTYQEVIP